MRVSAVVIFFLFFRARLQLILNVELFSGVLLQLVQFVSDYSEFLSGFGQLFFGDIEVSFLLG